MNKLELDKLLNNKTPLHISGGKPISQAFLNKYFLLFTPDQIMFFENLYLELKKNVDSFKIDGPGFFYEVHESYIRYQKHNALDPFVPMDKKAQHYVEKYIRKVFKRTNEKFNVPQST